MPLPIGAALAIGGALGLGGSLFGRDDRRDVQKALNQQQLNADIQMRALQAAAAGKAPSVAQEQLRAALQASAAQQQGLALGARPGQSQALARRNALQTGAAMKATAAGQGAQLRAAEMAAARQQLSQFITALRGQDLQGVIGTAGQPGGYERFLGGLQGGLSLPGLMPT